ncbi:helix-turn-helix transcriptional regulator [Mycobacterium malmoense]|uniref:Transcriptional regulator n=1 Tax=Mycobacterium malmoense TaxID=1780 RepID=A0ABX3SXI0_MYCMA|nr:helix-turn-helix transcriptional regulator [Mycobacterium malmoense]OIN81810.1 transcriptional regulator [Mycobacterium malmoense]ORA85234.1 transcriptional regulator [Mycobacterium malmoense]QZA18301.1 helix-turn-helix transcriptional regulator [Mycobacterium malmoense]UNB95072.1 helix-turn-helix transcriptional regulator [Mycobacterium malmoense]
MSETFNALLAERLKDCEFARHFAAESARIAAIDAVLNQLDDAREASNLTKAQLARAIGSDPSVVRRLLSAQTVNPTLATVAELAAALGLKVTLTPMSAEERKRITEPMLTATG